MGNFTLIGFLGIAAFFSMDLYVGGMTAGAVIFPGIRILKIFFVDRNSPSGRFPVFSHPERQLFPEKGLPFLPADLTISSISTPCTKNKKRIGGKPDANDMKGGGKWR